MLNRRILTAIFTICMVVGITPLLHAQRWVLLGESHLDGQHDHDVIEVGRQMGRLHELQVRVRFATIRFDRIVVHYGGGTSETVHLRRVIRGGDQSRPIRLAGGERFVHSLELWYSRAQRNSPKPEVRLWGAR